MARAYRVGVGRRVVNAAFAFLTRHDLGRPYRHLLTVRGRRTGREYSVPVDVMADGGERWLVAPYGDVGWVRNARAAGRVVLSRGGRSETVSVDELEPEQRPPILRRYLNEVRVARPYFDAGAEASDEALLAEAERHSVFRITRVETRSR